MNFLHWLYICFLFVFWICFYFWFVFLWLLDMFYIEFVFSLLTSFPLGNCCLNSKQNTNKRKSNLKWTSNEPDLDVNRSWNELKWVWMYSQSIWWYHSDNTAITRLSYSGLVHYIRKKKNNFHSLTGVKSTIQTVGGIWAILLILYNSLINPIHLEPLNIKSDTTVIRKHP